MEKYLCIHGHFYQPPRENPWLEEIEIQPTAAPYHDWNEKIAAECYAPNSASRIIDSKNQILKIINNYQKLSFNFGPSLLSWLKKYSAETYSRIIEADRLSQKERSGHGNAIAQGYNHIIMPLASKRDQKTQVIWAIKDFEYHFQRKPEGMWLPETAVNMEVLQTLSEQGIKFTILAPHQARRIRKIGAEEWMDTGQGNIDPTLAYKCFLRDGYSIVIFFYDAPISFSIAFDRVLESGDYFVQRIMKGFNDGRVWPQILNLATDGESYGHHFKFGEMALTYALDYIERNNIAKLTNYGEYLEKYPPKFQVEIFENTSWSCAHGIQRWRANCGCNSGRYYGWNQHWRQPLREGLDRLKSSLDELFEREGGRYLADPWAARDAYIEVILNRARENVEQFLARHQRRPLEADEKVQVLKLLEMQRCGLLMFTSCGWFFDDISGIETVQILKYAARAIQLAREVGGAPEIEKALLDKLAEAKSNICEMGTGADIFRKQVLPSQVDFRRVLTHYAISSLYEDWGQQQDIYTYRLIKEDFEKREANSSHLAIGKVIASSQITWETHHAAFVVFHPAGLDLRSYLLITDAAKENIPSEEFKQNLLAYFARSDIEGVNRIITENFGSNYLSLGELFLEERIKITSLISKHILKHFTDTYRSLYLEHYRMMDYLREVEVPIPKGFLVAAEYFLYDEFINQLKNLATPADEASRNKLSSIMEQAEHWQVKLSTQEVGLLIRQQLENRFRLLAKDPAADDLATIRYLFAIAEKLQLSMNLWQMQNFFSAILQNYPELLRGGNVSSSKLSNERIEELRQLGRLLKFNMG
ncbi:MAG: DUF3536 domain-containing protein [bacterium]|nr:DUF3536 domain-containing protein [bacterium]